MTTPDPRTTAGFVPFRSELAERYRAAGYWRGRPLGELLRRSARRRPDQTAVAGQDRMLSYAELDVAADRLASGLTELGMAPGDRIVVQLGNTPIFAVALFGLLRAGVVPVMALPAHRAHEIGHLAAVSEAVGYLIPDRIRKFDYRSLAAQVCRQVPSVRHVLVDGDPGPYAALAGVDATPCALPEPDPESIAVLLVSGGTTGPPKLIPRTHDDYDYNARASAEVCGLDADDVYLVTLPAAHNFPLACPGILGTLGVGGTVVFLDDPSPECAFTAIERHGVTVTAVVPPLAQLWCAAAEWESADLRSLRLLQVGGSKLARSHARQVRPALGAQLQQVFGMAEGLLNFTRLDDPDDLVEISQGRPMSAHDEIRIVDDDGREVAPGAEGELLVRGPYTIRGYYRAPEHNLRAITPDGFYRSGDRVRRLDTGHLVVTGRIKDVVNRGGENVAADELEEHLVAHPAIAQATVVGVPDEALGERICAVLVVREATPTLPEIKEFLTSRGLASYKTPDLVRTAPSLPVTAVGKIDKRAVIDSIRMGTPRASAESHEEPS